jgi:hypothetical protein
VSELRSNFVTRALEWLRAGYPSGVPKQDYVVLLGLLRRKLTDHEVLDIATELASLSDKTGENITVEDIQKLITEATLDKASPEDVSRVSSHLAAGGWPLAEEPA